MASNSAETLSTAVLHLNAGYYFQIAAFVMLIYDHILTFPDEVERIWRQKFSAATLLFLLNRYITPLEFIVILDAFHDPTWSKTTCDKFAVFEGAASAVLVAIGELVMILRVFALYERSTAILTFLMVLWTAQVAISAFGLHTGFAVSLPSPLVGCILIGTGPAFSALWVAPLVTDTCIFALTLYRTRSYIRDSGKTPTMHIFLRDGALYFFIIFMANLMNTLIYFLAPDDLKAVGASFGQLITATMISRIVLNLRSLSTSSREDDSQLQNNSYHKPRSRREIVFLTRTIGNLGEDFDWSYESGRAEAPNEQLEEIPMVNIRSSNETPV